MKKWLRLLGSSALVAVVAWRLDWEQLGQAFAGLRLLPWLLALGLYVLAQLLSSVRWQLLAQAAGFGGSTRRYCAYYFLGMFFNLVLPTSVGGDVVRAWYLGDQKEVPLRNRRSAAALSVFVDRLSGLVVLIGVACLSLVCCPVPLPGWIVATVTLVGVAGLAGLLALPFVRPLLAAWAPWLGPRAVLLANLADGCLAYARQPRLLLLTTLLSVGVQVLNVAVVALVGSALGLELAPQVYGVVVPLVTLLTLLPVSINGVGLRESAYPLLLAPVGVAAADAVALSLLSFAVTGTAGLAGVIVLAVGVRSPRGAWSGERGGEIPVCGLLPPPSTLHAARSTSLEGSTVMIRLLSVIIPVKDEVGNLRPLHERLSRALDPLCAAATIGDYELLFVDDGSGDGSDVVLEELAEADRRVKVVRLRRNFGQTPALQAGIDWSSGDVLATMDGDLQNDPDDIPMLLDRLAEGYDAVLGQRKDRKDNLLIRKVPSLLGNWLIRRVTGTPVRDLGCTLRVMRRDLAEALPLYGEMHRFIPVLAQMHGARVAQIEVRHHPRTAGKTKYSLSRTPRVLLDLITVKFLHTYLTRPMHVFGLAGLASMGLGVLCFLATLVMKYGMHWMAMTSNPLLPLGVMFELVGVQLISLGLMGEVLARTYFESQGKASYAVRGTLNLEPPAKRRAA